MPTDCARARPNGEIGGWIVDGLILLALCVAASEGHRVAFGFFALCALYAVVGQATRAHGTGAHLIPAGLRVRTALLNLACSVILTAEAFSLFSGTTIDMARWGFTAACAITLVARITGWHAAAVPAEATG